MTHYNHLVSAWIGASSILSRAVDTIVQQQSPPPITGQAVSVLEYPTTTSSSSTTDNRTSISFQLDWTKSAQFAGILLADHYGLFPKHVDVEIRDWQSNDLNVVDQVASGAADLACAEQNLIVSAQAKGEQVQAVATMLQESPYGLMSNRPFTLQDLQHQTVGVHVDGVKVLEWIVAVNDLRNVTIQEIPYEQKWERVVRGECFAVQTYVINEPIGIQQTFGVEPHVLPLSNYGFLSTAETIVVSIDVLKQHGDTVTKIVSAAMQGWQRALADKPRAAQIIVNHYMPPEAPDANVNAQEQVLERIEPYVMGNNSNGKSDDAIVPGVIDPQRWKEACELMLQYGIVESLPEDLDATLATKYFQGID